MLFVLSFFLLPVLALRPSNASLCDYYAMKLYGANTTTSQFNLVQSIVALAFAGPSGLPNVSTSLTGIFNPGQFENLNVDLLPWFNGSLDSSNTNGRPTAINWLNGGGSAPLSAFLTGQTSAIVLGNTTNQYQLFNHWIAAFSPYVFGCTLPPALPPRVGPVLNLAYVHKFMDLNHTEVGHFINQLVLASVYFGFEQGDADRVSTSLNAKYNVRCSPAVGTQLFSLCMDDTCPLAESPNCAAYLPDNLGPSGVISSMTATGTAAAKFTPSTVSTAAPSSTTTSASTSSPPATASTGGTSLSAGTIAGIAIGGGALTFAFVLALVFLIKKKFKSAEPAPSYDPTASNPDYFIGHTVGTDPHSSYISAQRVQAWNGPQSTEWTGPPIHEMPTPVGSPELSNGQEMRQPLK